MTSSILAHGTPRRNTFVQPASLPSQHEQGRILYRLGFSISVCVADEHARGYLDEEALQRKQSERKAARNG